MENRQLTNPVSTNAVPKRVAGRGGQPCSDDKMTEIFENIKGKLEKEQLYLDTNLSLVKFSSIIGTNTTYLSNVVNDKFGCNLRTLINRYRINYAKALLESEETSIRELPERSGFASRSAFYVAFLRNTGYTPSEYYARRIKHRRK